MSWPLPQDFNEAIQSPAFAFSDPDLKAGEPVSGPTGLPLPRSGNFADVYEVRGADGRGWGVKCFTRPVFGLEARYAAVARTLAKADLPFGIDFQFLVEGIRVGGVWRPAVKMEWVEGLLLNQVLKENAGRPAVLAALFQMWTKMCRRLREVGIAHADLQHGNVILVQGKRAGSFALRLIDYDGMYVPKLASMPSGELGHPNYQHPARATTREYSADLDRFPHLVVASALTALECCGPAVWGRYDTGDNLLFTDADFKSPTNSRLMRTLWDSGHSQLRALVGRLAIACTRPIAETPWLDHVAPDGKPLPLDDATTRTAADLLGLPSEPVIVGEVVATTPGVVNDLGDAVPPAPPPRPVLEPPPKQKKNEWWRDEDEEDVEDARKQQLVMVLGGLALLLGLGVIVGAVLLLRGDRKTGETVETTPPTGKNPEVWTPGTKGEAKEPLVQPVPKPESVTVPVPMLTRRWETFGPPGSQLKVSTDGKWVLGKPTSAGFVQMMAADRGTGAGSMSLGGGAVGFAAFPGGKVAGWSMGQREFTVWNPASRAVDRKIALPATQAGPGEPEFDVSPDGRYVIVGYRPFTPQGPAGPLLPGVVTPGFSGVPAGGQPGQPPHGDITVVDLQQQKEVFRLWVRAPRYRFTGAGELLVADVDWCKWFRLPGGDLFKQVDLPAARLPYVTAVSPDGDRILFSGDQKSRLIDTRTGQVLAEYPTDRTVILWGEFSPDGRYVALMTVPATPGPPGLPVRLDPKQASAGPTSGTVEVIDLRDGTVVAREQAEGAPSPPAAAAVFTPDGRSLVIGRVNGRVQLYDLPADLVAAAPGPKPKEPEVPETPVVTPKPKTPDPTPVTLEMPPSPDFNAVTPRLRLTAPGGTTNRFANRVQFSLDGKAVVLSRAPLSGEITVHNAATGNLVRKVEERNLPVRAYSCGTLADGRLWAVQTGDKSFGVWNTNSGARMASPPVPPLPASKGSAVNHVAAMSPDGRYTAYGFTSNFRNTTGGIDQGQFEEVPARVFDNQKGVEVLDVSWRSGSVHFTSDSSRVLFFDAYGKAQWYSLPDGQPLDEWVHQGPKTGTVRTVVLGMSWDGKVLLCEGLVPAFGVGRTGHFVLDGTTGKFLKMFGGANEYLAQVGGLSADGKLAVLAKNDQQGNNATYLTVVDTEKGQVKRLALANTTTASRLGVGISPDGRSAAALVTGGDLSLFDLVKQ
jgi:WD40 repeat protein